jgi:Xaa-Pro aminopeptidase
LNLDVRDGSPTVHEMRRSKDETEVAAIGEAIEVTAQAFDRLLGSVREGLQEHELEAEIARVYRAHGATHAFDPIVACGARALQLHYRDNRGPVVSDELLLVDSGASLNGYKADITRTYPVNGRFSKRQRQVYETVLEALGAAVAACKPGVLLGDLHRHAWEVIERAGFGEHFIHGTSHHLGLETHDVGDVHRPLTAGAVITVEPGIYLPDEQLGVRIEDDVLITESGHRVLSVSIPRTIDEIERRMAGKGR